MQIFIKCLNNFLVKSKTKVQARVDFKKTKSGSGKVMKFGVTKFLLEFYLAESRAELVTEICREFWQ